MATSPIIAIKRSQSNSAPSTLANGEIAYSFSSDKLFIGQTDAAGDAVTVEYIGGKLIVDKVANLESVVFSGNRSYTNFTVGANLVLSSITNNAVLITKTGGVVDGVTGTSGQLFQVAANGTPYFDDLNGGSF